MPNFRRRFIPLLILGLLLFGVGTLGYMLIEDWSLVEAVWREEGAAGG